MLIPNIVIERFINLVCNSWQSINEIDKDDATGSFRIDLMQAYWELAVEGALINHIESPFAILPYGDGADANGASSRILYPERKPTHSIRCVPKDSISLRDELNNLVIDFPKDGFDVDRFVTLERGWFCEKPPFDAVLVDNDNQQMAFRNTLLNFIVVEL